MHNNYNYICTCVCVEENHIQINIQLTTTQDQKYWTLIDYNRNVTKKQMMEYI